MLQERLAIVLVFVGCFFVGLGGINQNMKLQDLGVRPLQFRFAAHSGSFVPRSLEADCEKTPDD